MMQSRPMEDGPRTCTPSQIAVSGPIVTPGSMIAVGWMRAPCAAAGAGPAGAPPALGSVSTMVISLPAGAPPGASAAAAAHARASAPVRVSRTPLMSKFYSLVGAAAAEHRGDRLQEDLDVEPEGPVVDVLHLALDPVLELRRAPVHLPQAGDARLHAEAPLVS